MSKKVWLITGAGRGMGTDIAKAALASGHAVVATGRDAERVTAAIGAQDDLLAVKLDVTNPDDAKAAVHAAVDNFGRVDVLVNNAGNFIAGFFEEIRPDDFRAQIETNLFGPLNVTRAVLPVMRQQRSGLVIAISSTGGIVGQEFCSAYSASKFGLILAGRFTSAPASFAGSPPCLPSMLFQVATVYAWSTVSRALDRGLGVFGRLRLSSRRLEQHGRRPWWDAERRSSGASDSIQPSMPTHPLGRRC